MFQDACSRIFPCLCQVGGFSTIDVFLTNGMGCLIGAGYAITAKHVADFDPSICDDLAIMHSSGVWACSIVGVWEQQDIAVLKIGRQLASGSKDQGFPEQYPRIGGCHFAWGVSVGYFGALHRMNRSGEPDRFTYFAAASLSFFTRDVHRWALSAGFAKEGFSGSPVFIPNGSLVGVLTDIMRIAEPTPGEMPQLVTVPLMTPFKAEIIKGIASLAGSPLIEG